jgi:hypothetical protein
VSVLTIASIKAGPGKSTVAMLLAGASQHTESRSWHSTPIRPSLRRLGWAGATWGECSGTATASVVTGHVRNGPLGTSAESSRVDVTTQGCIDMKTSLKPRVRLSPDEIATETAPALPPMRLTSDDKAQSFNTRLRASTIAAIEARARAEGATLKQVICRALFDAGIEVAAVDLEDGTPRRRAA